MSQEVEKTCADCKCRTCNPITAMSERLDAFHAAKNLLKDIRLPEDMYVTPQEILILANWLYSGSDDDE